MKRRVGRGGKRYEAMETYWYLVPVSEGGGVVMNLLRLLLREGLGIWYDVSGAGTGALVLRWTNGISVLRAMRYAKMFEVDKGGITPFQEVFGCAKEVRVERRLSRALAEVLKGDRELMRKVWLFKSFSGDATNFRVEGGEVVYDRKGVDVKALGLRIVPYSEKSFVVVGNSYRVADMMRYMGGVYNSHLRCGGGWVFSYKHLDEVKKFLGEM